MEQNKHELVNIPEVISTLKLLIKTLTEEVLDLGMQINSKKHIVTKLKSALKKYENDQNK